ncbi:alpha/beta hydrolase [Ktedonosporobacter rubrisoli]|uniref:Alpha/beta hydrolase n=2 Tax=Ktedonosporobacter rubrisoli TaxID=2509675 RepID=A0A4P6K7C3_KTERU|nr:alpha/beta hydrolase [Ktedonosporobacter rubrisoli]
MDSKALRHSYGNDPQQFGELFLPEGPGPFPVVLLIHGGFWHAPYNLSLMTGLAEDLIQRNIAVWNIEYRRIEDVGGGWPGTFQDVAHASDYLQTLAQQYALDMQRVIPVGHSAGGHLALWLAARSKFPEDSQLAALSTPPYTFKGIVSLAGANDLEQVWQLNLEDGSAATLLGGTPMEVPERYALASPAALLPLGIPQILIHGDKDDRVPIEVSQAYALQAKDAGDQLTLIELPGVDHFALIDPSSEAWAITIRALQKLL